MIATGTDRAEHAEVVVIGGGFYGCCMALFLRSRYDKVIVLEAQSQLLQRASYVNQARVHTGFHYPRSFTTAQRSLALHQRFSADFKEAVVDDFVMLYAIARQGSKVTPQRFDRMFRDLGAPIAPASAAETALFSPDRIAAVFRCHEAAFDSCKLRDILSDRLEHAGVDVRFGARVRSVGRDSAGAMNRVQLDDGHEITAPLVVNATYGLFTGGAVDRQFGAQLKFELVEIAMVQPPVELQGYGITVMDGPFFSIMPFPARDCYSLTHVRYTPHLSWHGRAPDWPQTPRSNWMHMQRDAARFMPCLRDLRAEGSLFEIKTVLQRNESDDGRPILLFEDPAHPGYMSILGGKLDNIYDLFDVLGTMNDQASGCDTSLMTGETGFAMRMRAGQ